MENREIKFKFVLQKEKDVIITPPYSLEEMCKMNYPDDIYDELELRVAENMGFELKYEGYKIIDKIQYIGKKDNIGIEIYESDIVNIKVDGRTITGKVKYSETGWAIEGYGWAHRVFNKAASIRVIGNKYKPSMGQIRFDCLGKRGNQ